MLAARCINSCTHGVPDKTIGAVFHELDILASGYRIGEIASEGMEQQCWIPQPGRCRPHRQESCQPKSNQD